MRKGIHGGLYKPVKVKKGGTMRISNSELKSLLNLHNYLPNKEEFKYISDEYRKAIIRYEKILSLLLEQKMRENEQTREYLNLKGDKPTYE